MVLRIMGPASRRVSAERAWLVPALEQRDGAWLCMAR
jgi:hypothetical protein